MGKGSNRKEGKYMMMGCFAGLLVGVIMNKVVMGLAIGLLVGTLLEIIIYSKRKNLGSK